MMAWQNTKRMPPRIQTGFDVPIFLVNGGAGIAAGMVASMARA